MLKDKVLRLLRDEVSVTSKVISEKLNIRIRLVRGALPSLLKAGLLIKKRKGNLYFYYLKDRSYLNEVKKEDDIKNIKFKSIINKSKAMYDRGFFRRANSLALEAIKFAKTESEISQAMTLASKFAKASKSKLPAFYAVAGKCNLDEIRGFDKSLGGILTGLFVK